MDDATATEGGAVPKARPKRKSIRGRAKRAVEDTVYAREIHDIFKYVTGKVGERDRKHTAKIGGDAARVVDDIIRQLELRCVTEMESNADPARSTLQCQDLYATLRKGYLMTNNQEVVVSNVKRAVDADLAAGENDDDDDDELD